MSYLGYRPGAPGKGIGTGVGCRKTEDRRQKRDDGRETVCRRLRRDELGLIGFVFLISVERVIYVRFCGIRGCVVFGGLGIGFVLRKKSDL